MSLRHHDSSFTTGQRDGHLMPSSIDYFVITGPSAANETCPTSVCTSAMALVLCETVRITHFMANTCRFVPSPDGLFTPTMHLTLNSYQFCFLLQFEGLSLQNTNRLLLERRASLQNEDSANIPASNLLVDCSPVLILCFPMHFLHLICTNLQWILFSIQQSTSPHWLPLRVRWSRLCFT